MATQAARRAGTVARLVQATADALCDLGYARTTVAAICERADLSQGALFRHFPSRIALVASTARHIGDQHLAGFAGALASGDPDWAGVVTLIRSLCRSRAHAAWHEVMVAARTDPALRDAVASVVADGESAVREAVAALVAAERADTALVALLSVMHAFDSEAVTVPIYGNAAVEQARLRWAEAVLRGAFHDFRDP
jgi:AcrR family transcriptional regulator